MPKVFTLRKEERLYLREAISDLFAKGRGFTFTPYRVKYCFLPETDSQKARVAIMTIVPKKCFRHAVERNRVKRLTREAYRLNKLNLIEAFSSMRMRLQIAFIYNSSDFISFNETESVIKACIRLLIKHGVKEQKKSQCFK